MLKIKNLTFYTNKIKQTELHFLILSDIHATNKDLSHLEKIIYSQEIDFKNLDYILIPGDIVNDTNDLLNLKFKKRFLELLKELTENIPTFVSYGNHDQMTKNKNGNWNLGNKSLLDNTLKELNNLTVINNGQTVVASGISFAALSPCFSYYNNWKENKIIYEKLLHKTYNNPFAPYTYNIFLTHEPHSIIELSEQKGECIIPNTDLVISGHMHNGLLPNFLHPYFKNRGIISPQKGLFPRFAQGEFQIAQTTFLINGPVNSRIETPIINELYKTNATILNLKKKS